MAMVNGINDVTCDPTMAEYVYSQLGTEDKHLNWEQGGHEMFFLNIFDPLIDRLVSAIETG